MSIHIYTKPNCSYCVKAKSLMVSKEIPYTEHIIGTTLTRDTFLELFPNARTVPVIVEDGVIIGGYDQLVEHLEENNGDQSPELLQG